MTDTPRFQSLCSRVVTLMEHLKVPGVAIGIWHNGEEHTAGLGVTHIHHPQPVTPVDAFPDRLDQQDFRRHRGHAAG